MIIYTIKDHNADFRNNRKARLLIPMKKEQRFMVQTTLQYNDKNQCGCPVFKAYK